LVVGDVSCFCLENKVKPSNNEPQQINTLITINITKFNKKSTPNYIWQETSVKKATS